MNIYLSKNFLISYKNVTKRNKTLKYEIKNKLNLYRKNPKHPSLRLHKLKGRFVESWSITIESNIRIIFTYVNDGILLVDIGTHDEVYS